MACQRLQPRSNSDVENPYCGRRNVLSPFYSNVYKTVRLGPGEHRRPQKRIAMRDSYCRFTTPFLIFPIRVKEWRTPIGSCTSENKRDPRERNKRVFDAAVTSGLG